MRACGILLPVSCIPSKYGIGCFSKEAYEFVDQLVEAGQKYWQILPLGPTGYGDSPYQSFSTFAGNPYYIDLERLVEEGLLTEEECNSCDFGDDPKVVDYGAIYQCRNKILYHAFKRSNIVENVEFINYCNEQAEWLNDYALYREIKFHFDGKSWNEWDEDIRIRKPEAIKHFEEECAEGILFHKYLQFEFSRQWKELKAYANQKGIQVIGDIPIYVAFDSADSWSHPELFQFDENCVPVQVAGCPPDGFSATGQLWGNPLYNWEYHKKTGYEWWTKRVLHCRCLYDVLRIDHFRGFDEFYSIPYGEDTAKNGKWNPGPGLEFFETISKKLGHMRIIAEDLGYLTDSVIELVKNTGYPGMKLLQFAFDSREAGNYLPYKYDRNSVVYTGTHDNNTICGWYKTICEEDRQMALQYLGKDDLKESEVAWEFIRLALSTVSDLCIIPLQDYLELGEEARMNTPSVLGGNWSWRFQREDLTTELLKRIRQMCEIYGRV